MRPRGWSDSVRESSALAYGSVRAHPARSVLAITGVVIGIVTVVLVATVLANVRNQIALLFRELGTDNVFAFHLSGDPYSPASDEEARRLPLDRRFGAVIAREPERRFDELALRAGGLRERIVEQSQHFVVGGQGLGVLERKVCGLVFHDHGQSDCCGQR